MPDVVLSHKQSIGMTVTARLPGKDAGAFSD